MKSYTIGESFFTADRRVVEWLRANVEHLPASETRDNLELGLRQLLAAHDAQKREERASKPRKPAGGGK